MGGNAVLIKSYPEVFGQNPYGLRKSPVGAGLFHADTQRDVTNLIDAFRNSWNAPKKKSLNPLCTTECKHNSQGFNFNFIKCNGVGRDSSVGMATGYGLDGLGIESWWGARFSLTCPDRPSGPPSLQYNGYRVFHGGKERPGCDADPSTLVPWSRKIRAIPLFLL